MDNNNTFMEPKPQYGKRMRMMMSPQGELDSALCQACYDGDIAEVEKLLEKGASAKATHDGGWTALHSAAGHGNLEMVTLLVEDGADLNAKNFRNETALHCACYCGAADVAMYLVEMGANPKVKDVNGMDCITFAKENGHDALAVDMLAEFMSATDMD
jgi:ankyrin repeat protein